MKKIIIMLVVALTAQVKANAQKPGVVISGKPGWHKIGEVSADFKLENESILVIGADKFKAIKLKTTDASINIQSLQVYYETGEMDDVVVKSELSAGEETNIINIKSDRELKKVVFTYKTAPNERNKKATVELYGLK